MPEDAPKLRTILLRGLTRRCPRCSKGPLFQGWLKLRRNCPNCDLRYLLNQGDPWAFLLVVDRLFLFVVIAIIYFKLWPKSLPLLLVVFGGVMAVFIATTPFRYGLCVAIDFWTRTRWGDQVKPAAAVESGESGESSE